MKPNPWNSNRVGPEMEARIDASLREFGFMKPVVARELADGSLQIIGGEHRTRRAAALGIESIPVVILQNVDDKRAKAMGLADNGRYGEDDAIKLAAILGDLGEDLIATLAIDEKDLASIFASSGVDLDMLGLDDDADDLPALPAADATRPTITHELMRFKVPVEDRERVEKFFSHIVKTRGLAAETDSMVAAGMALVEIVKIAQEVA